jgi:hypothetical protein
MGDAYTNTVQHAVDKYMPLRHGNVEDVRKDVISHFALRLAFCPQQHRSWFVSEETLLLEHRLMSMGTRIPEFFAENRMDYTPISEELFREHEEGLKTGI